MIEKAMRAIQRYQLLSRGDTVIVALSGGADSIALLSFLNSIREEWGLKLQAAHVNHCLRGEESERDEAFARAFCEGQGIPLSVRRTDVAALAKERGEGLEACGRQVRYAYFEELAAGRDDLKIALAHTLSDSAETLLLHLARGSGLRGAGGIPPRRGRIIRPLIHCTRQEILAYCSSQGLTYMTDSSNADDHFARNRVRHTVLPGLMTVNPDFLHTAERFMETARLEDAFLERLAQKAYAEAGGGEGLCVSDLRSMDTALRRRVLRQFAREAAGVVPEFAQVERLEACLETGEAMELSLGVRIRVYRGRLLAFPPCKKEDSGKEDGPNESGVNRFVLTYEEFLNIEQNAKKRFAFYADYDKISGDVVLRSREPGDKLIPAGNKLSKSLKKLFQEAGVPAEKRSLLPVICDSAGVIGVWGLCCAQRVNLDNTTRRVLILTD